MNSQIGKKIKSLRTIKGLSQEQAADYLKISQSTYARIEKGDTNSWVTYLEPLSRLYNIQPEDLLKQDTVKIDNLQNNSGAIYNLGTVNALSEKLIEQFELRLSEKDKIIAELKSQIDTQNI